MNRGISFEIPNEYGSALKHMLAPFPVAAYNWYVGGEESYCVVNKELEPLFPQEYFGMEGSALQLIIDQPNVYLIFQSLKAFPFNTEVNDVTTYEEFLHSDCQFILLVIDSVYIAMYCKNDETLVNLYHNAINQGYEKVQCITEENDFRTKLSVWYNGLLSTIPAINFLYTPTFPKRIKGAPPPVARPPNPNIVSS